MDWTWPWNWHWTAGGFGTLLLLIWWKGDVIMLYRIAKSLDRIADNQLTGSDLDDLLFKLKWETDAAASLLQDIKAQTKEMTFNLEEIRQVASIHKRYKLPDKRSREILDELASEEARR